ncbi:MAG: exodeoxyribonuclease VII large subunit [Betaproteobacteria bacterium]
MNPTSERGPAGRIWGVAALVQALGDALQARFGSIRVCGELSACTQAASGHRYFSLKDAQGHDALIRCALFKRSAAHLSFVPRDGLQVEAVGRLALYEPRGDLQFIVESLHLVGSGSLYEEFLRLKSRLQAEGLFDEARKRPLPAHPRRIAVVSSLQAAALRDVLTAIQRRAPHVKVVVFPSLVQGTDAPAALVRALQQAADDPATDVVILARGGGSLEDLWCFNDERVVRAVVGCPIPLVCGVGHETDVTLSDFAADVRAATPTAAAELATPVREDELQTLAERARQLALSVQRSLDRQAQHLDQVGMAVRRPAAVLSRHQQGLQALQGRLARAALEPLKEEGLSLQRRASRLMAAQTQQLTLAQRHWDRLRLRLQAQDPAAVLQRGYAWVSDAHGAPLTSALQAATGQTLTAVWHDGRAQVHVESVHPVAEGDSPRPP